MAYVRSQHMDELSRLGKHQKMLHQRKSTQAVPEEDIFVDQKDNYLARLLAEAGLESRYDAMKSQWIMFAIGGAVVGLLGGMIGFNSVDLGILGLIFGLPFGASAFIMYVKHLAKRRQDRMTEQLPQVLESMSSALKAGSPVMEVYKLLAETAPEPIRAEFKRALVALQLGKSFRDVMNDMCLRIKTPDFRLLTQAIFISQDVGGNLADVVAVIAEAVRERFKLRDYLNSLTAQGKATALFIGMLPYFITGMTYMVTPGYIIPFLNHPIGRLVFISLVVWEFIGFWILMKLTTFEV
jgi:tight adherence protein B